MLRVYRPTAQRAVGVLTLQIDRAAWFPGRRPTLSANVAETPASPRFKFQVRSG